MSVAADISPSTTKILECIPKIVVKNLVAKCLPSIKIDWGGFEQGSFYPSTIAAINKLEKESAAEFYDIIRRVNEIARHRENGRFILEEIKAAGRMADMAADLPYNHEIAAMSAWVYCEMPELWARITKRTAAAEVESYRTVTRWFEKPRPTMSPEDGEMCFCQMLKDYLNKVSQPLKHVHLDRDVGDDVTRYVIHFDPYPQKVPTFAKEESDELDMRLGIEAERFQVTVFHEARKLVVRCQFSNEQTEHIVKLFLDYVLQAARAERPQSHFDIERFNAASFDWDTSRDEDVIDCRTYGVKFVINHPDGLIEEIGHARSRGDILAFVDERYGEGAFERATRSMLEVHVDVTIFSGRRPSMQQVDLEGRTIDVRRPKSVKVRLTETGRSVKCRNRVDKAKVEAFLDHNGLHDLNNVVR